MLSSVTELVSYKPLVFLLCSEVVKGEFSAISYMHKGSVRQRKIQFLNSKMTTTDKGYTLKGLTIF